MAAMRGTVCERVDGSAGVSLGEYAVLLALIAVTCVGTVTAMKNQFVAVFSATGEAAEGVRE